MCIRQMIAFGICFLSFFSYNTHSLQPNINMKDNLSTETTYEYGEDGRVKEVHHENGMVEIYEYDKNGNLIQITVRTEASSESGNPTGEATTGQATTGQDATTENPSGENEPSSDNNSDVTGESSSGYNGGTVQEVDSGENDTGDYAPVEICLLAGIVSALLLIAMGRKKL